jgi:hypothetical protein
MKVAKQKRRFAGTHLDDGTFSLLRKMAIEEGRSLSSMIAFFVRKGVSTPDSRSAHKATAA